MEKQKEVSGIYSWKSIILFLIFLWPVGIYLLYKRQTADNKTQLNAYSKVIVIGWVLLAMGVVTLFAWAGGDEELKDSLSGILLVLAGGIALLVWGRRMKVTALKYKKYIALVANQGMYRLNEIANAAVLPYETVKNDLNRMIECDYFPGAYLDENKDEIVLAAHAAGAGMQEATGTQAQYAQQGAEQRVVTCDGCGAKNVVTGSLGRCDYCGSPLQ